VSTTPAAPPSPLALGLLHLLKHLRPFEARGYLREASSALDAAERGLLRRQLVAIAGGGAPATRAPEDAVVAPPSPSPSPPASTAEILANALPRRRWARALVGLAVALSGTGAALLVQRTRSVCPEAIAAVPCPGPAPAVPELEPAPLAPPPVRRHAGAPKRPVARAVDPFDSRF
jgi:hypothetical protein